MNMKDAMDYARPIMMTDMLLYQHSINVATICYYAAEKMNLDPEKAFVGGLLHDYGKLAFLKITLMDGPGSVAFMDHPVLGYAILKDDDKDSAIMAYTHHLYQHNCYPSEVEIDIPERLEPYCQLIAYVDKIEAFMTRSCYGSDEAVSTVNTFYPFMDGLDDAVYEVIRNRPVVRLT